MAFVNHCPTCKSVMFTQGRAKSECESCRQWYNILFRQLKEFLFPNIR